MGGWIVVDLEVILPSIGYPGEDLLRHKEMNLPLDMRMNQSQVMTAADLINQRDPKELDLYWKTLRGDLDMLQNWFLPSRTSTEVTCPEYIGQLVQIS